MYETTKNFYSRFIVTKFQESRFVSLSKACLYCEFQFVTMIFYFSVRIYLYRWWCNGHLDDRYLFIFSVFGIFIFFPFRATLISSVYFKAKNAEKRFDLCYAVFKRNIYFSYFVCLAAWDRRECRLEKSAGSNRR